MNNIIYEMDEACAIDDASNTQNKSNILVDAVEINKLRKKTDNIYKDFSSDSSFMTRTKAHKTVTYFDKMALKLETLKLYYQKILLEEKIQDSVLTLALNEFKSAADLAFREIFDDDTIKNKKEDTNYQTDHDILHTHLKFCNKDISCEDHIQEKTEYDIYHVRNVIEQIDKTYNRFKLMNEIIAELLTRGISTSRSISEKNSEDLIKLYNLTVKGIIEANDNLKEIESNLSISTYVVLTLKCHYLSSILFMNHSTKYCECINEKKMCCCVDIYKKGFNVNILPGGILQKQGQCYNIYCMIRLLSLASSLKITKDLTSLSINNSSIEDITEIDSTDAEVDDTSDIWSIKGGNKMTEYLGDGIP